MMHVEHDKVIYTCNLCEQEFTYKHWRDEKTKGLEIVRMHLGLCSKCYHAFKGDRVTNKEDKSRDEYLEITKEESNILWDLIQQEMRRQKEQILEEWSKSYDVTDFMPFNGRMQRFKPQDEVYAQHQLLKLTKLFRKIRDNC